MINYRALLQPICVIFSRWINAMWASYHLITSAHVSKCTLPAGHAHMCLENAMKRAWGSCLGAYRRKRKHRDENISRNRSDATLFIAKPSWSVDKCASVDDGSHADLDDLKRVFYGKSFILYKLQGICWSSVCGNSFLVWFDCSYWKDSLRPAVLG